MRLGLINGEVEPLELRLLVNLEDLRGLIAGLGEVRDVLLTVDPAGST